MNRPLPMLAVVLAVSLTVGASRAQQEGALPTVPGRAVSREPSVPIGRDDPEAAERAARGEGRYAMLLHQFEDRTQRVPHVEAGYQERATYCGQRDLPAGYWVYAEPYWFIFRDFAERPRPSDARRWGPEQATGAPDTPGCADTATAWAAKLEDNPDGEWLLAEFASGIKATAVEIHESFNAGAIARVSLFRDDGSEIDVWHAERVAAIDGRRELRVPLPLGFRPRRIKLYLDAATVPGWNEIDAIGLVDDRGALHWATAVAASSTFASEPSFPVPPPLPPGLPQPLPPIPWAAEAEAKPAVEATPQVGIREAPAAATGAGGDGTHEALEARVAVLERALAEQKALVDALRQEIAALKKERR